MVALEKLQAAGWSRPEISPPTRSREVLRTQIPCLPEAPEGLSSTCTSTPGTPAGFPYLSQGTVLWMFHPWGHPMVTHPRLATPLVPTHPLPVLPRQDMSLKEIVPLLQALLLLLLQLLLLLLLLLLLRGSPTILGCT